MYANKAGFTEEKHYPNDLSLIRPLDLETPLYHLLGGSGALKNFFSAKKNLT